MISVYVPCIIRNKNLRISDAGEQPALNNVEKNVNQQEDNRMEPSLIIGIVVGLAALLTGYTLEGGKLVSLMLFSPALIVIGGTIGATVASFSLKDILQSFKYLGKTFRQPNSTSTKKLIDKILEIAAKYRTEGITALDTIVQDPELQREDMLLLKEGLVLLQDGKNEEDIQYVLESELHAFSTQKAVEASVFESAGGYSPTMGVIGTVMSLVVVLAAGFGDQYGVYCNFVWRQPFQYRLSSDCEQDEDADKEEYYPERNYYRRRLYDLQGRGCPQYGK